MRATILPKDGTVTVDGEGLGDFDMSKVPDDIHAVQWYDTGGEIEYIDNPDDDVEGKPNKLIDKLPAWTNKLIKDHAKKKKEIEEMEVDDLPEERAPAPPRPETVVARDPSAMLRRLEELEKKIS